MDIYFWKNELVSLQDHLNKITDGKRISVVFVEEEVCSENVFI